MRALSPLALGITLAATVATANAQTVISRQVSEELVETIVTQDFGGTVVTRRILTAPAAVPVQPWQAPVTYNPATGLSTAWWPTNPAIGRVWPMIPSIGRQWPMTRSIRRRWPMIRPGLSAAGGL